MSREDLIVRLGAELIKRERGRLPATAGELIGPGLRENCLANNAASTHPIDHAAIEDDLRGYWDKNPAGATVPWVGMSSRRVRGAPG
jgi:hypothetical protein